MSLELLLLRLNYTYGPHPLPRAHTHGSQAPHLSPPYSAHSLAQVLIQAEILHAPSPPQHKHTPLQTAPPASASREEAQISLTSVCCVCTELRHRGRSCSAVMLATMCGFCRIKE
uniref:Uncharacterized protein n=1 Tax=Knipowitschia caucasica TaxID=637954 RepID=A0AAV2LHS8_KNICA